MGINLFFAKGYVACKVLNIDKKALSPEGLLKHYKAQSEVEKGFRFLKDPLFFVSSLFIKKPSRIDALLMVMTLSLLVYSIAQRRMRANMKKEKPRYQIKSIKKYLTQHYVGSFSVLRELIYSIKTIKSA